MEGRDECNVTIVDSTSTITTTTTMAPTTSATTISSAMTLTTREMTTVQAPQLPPTPTGAPTPPPPSTAPPPTPIGAPTPTPPPPPTTTPPPPTTTPSPAKTTTTTPPPSPTTTPPPSPTTTPPPTTPPPPPTTTPPPTSPPPPPSTTPTPPPPTTPPPPPSTTPTPATTTTTTPPPSPTTTPPPSPTTPPPPSTTPSPTEPVTGTELPPTAKLQTPLTETQITAPSNGYPTESTELDTSTEMQKLPTEAAEMMDVDEEPLWKDAEIKKLTMQVKNQQRELERMNEACLEENKLRRSCEDLVISWQTQYNTLLDAYNKLEDNFTKYKVYVKKRAQDLMAGGNSPNTARNQHPLQEEIPPNVQKIRSVSANSSWGGSRAYDAMLPSGLKNIGNTCYINSVLQCLFNVYDFSYHFIYKDYKQDLNRENKLNAEVVDVIAQIFQALHNKTPTDTYLRKFKEVLCKCDEQFVGSGQQDAHDLLAVVLTCLHEALTTVQDPANDSSTSIVSDIFHGLQESTIVCPKTGSVISRTRETFNSISLPVDMLKDWSLEELIKKHFEDQRIEWECVDCGTLHPCNHTTILVTLPIILIIHLSKYTKRSVRGQKNLVHYPVEGLRIKRHPTHDSVRIANYNLMGVCHHRGTANAGHYFALCKKWDDNNWYLYDDTYVSQLRSQHHAPDTAHILFYKAMTESYPTQIPHANSS